MSSEKQPIRLRHPLTSCGEMHLLPCSVQMERVGGGPARVDSYFAPLVREENDVTAGDMKVYSSSFRGRPLKGVKIDVPQGYTGVVLQESVQPQGSIPGDEMNEVGEVIITLLQTRCTQSRELEVKGHFSQFHYWNLQMSPTADDKLLQALVWAQLAPSVHSPTTSTTTNEKDWSEK